MPGLDFPLLKYLAYKMLINLIFVSFHNLMQHFNMEILSYI